MQGSIIYRDREFGNTTPARDVRLLVKSKDGDTDDVHIRLQFDNWQAGRGLDMEKTGWVRAMTMTMSRDQAKSLRDALTRHLDDGEDPIEKKLPRSRSA